MTRSVRLPPGSHRLKTVRAITLDLFGTLFDISDLMPRVSKDIVRDASLSVEPKVFCRAWKKHLYKRRWHTEFFSPMRGWFRISFIETMKTLHLTFDAEKATTELFKRLAHAHLYPETRKALDLLSECYPIYLLSNVDEDVMERLLPIHDLPIQGAISSEQVKSYKPNRKIFARARKKADIPAEHILHIGDELLYDVRGAQRAGFLSAWLNRDGTPLKRGYRPALQAGTLMDLAVMLLRKI